MVAKKSWSLIGTGEIEGTIEHDGRELPVKLVILAFKEDQLFVDGKQIPLKVVG